jgi:hypothetical protein
MESGGFILGFHGCDQTVGEKILAGQVQIRLSENEYDWLGSGAYFWENNPLRALSWACFVNQNPGLFPHTIKRPFVIGAIIETGRCLDLAVASSLQDLEMAYAEMRDTFHLTGTSMPINEAGFTGDLDLVKRHLDCAVINFLHSLREERSLPAFDTVRGHFPEGGPLFEGARIMARTHVQICVRTPERSIRGYFRPIPNVRLETP